MQGFVTFPRTFAWSNAWVAWKAAPAFGRNWNAFPPTLTRIFVVSASDSPLGQNWFRSMEPATFRSPCGMRPPMLGLLGYEVKNRSRESRTANDAGQEVQRPNQLLIFLAYTKLILDRPFFTYHAPRDTVTTMADMILESTITC